MFRAVAVLSCLLALTVSVGVAAPVAAPAQTEAETAQAKAEQARQARFAARDRAGVKIGARLRAKAEAAVPLAEQRAFLAGQLRSRGVGQKTADAVLGYAVDGISMRPTKARRASRLGGRALLPAGEAWPVNDRSKGPLSLLAVLDLAELHAAAPLPTEGTLELFYDSRGMEEDPSDAWLDMVACVEVRWYPPGTALVETRAPKRAPSYPVLSMEGVWMPIVGAVPYDVAWPGGARSVSLVDDMIFGVLRGAYSGDQLLGASQDIQEPVLDEIPYWFKETANAASRARYTREERKGNGWTLLAQTNGAGTDAMMFGDLGNVSFIVPTADLAAQRFDRAVAIFQT